MLLWPEDCRASILTLPRAVVVLLVEGWWEVSQVCVAVALVVQDLDPTRAVPEVPGLPGLTLHGETPASVGLAPGTA